MIESWGRGIEKIVAACHEEGKPDPVFETSRSEMSVMFIDDANTNQNDFIVPDGTINGTINTDGNGARLLRAILDNPAITYDGLSTLLSMPRRTVSREMKKMQEDGKIEREGARKNGRWIVKQE